MRIGDVAERLGVSVDWIRRLEKAGRVPPPRRDRNGDRRYSEADVARLREVFFPGSSQRNIAQRRLGLAPQGRRGVPPEDAA